MGIEGPIRTIINDRVPESSPGSLPRSSRSCNSKLVDSTTTPSFSWLRQWWHGTFQARCLRERRKYAWRHCRSRWRWWWPWPVPVPNCAGDDFGKRSDGTSAQAAGAKHLGLETSSLNSRFSDYGYNPQATLTVSICMS